MKQKSYNKKQFFILKYQKSEIKVLSMGKKDVISKKILKNIARDKIDYTYAIIDLNYYTKRS